MIDPADRNAILEATAREVRAMIGATPFDVVLENLEGGVARVRVTDRAGKLGALMGFLARKGKAWEPLAFGTFFPDEFYAQHKVPAALKL